MFKLIRAVLFVATVTAGGAAIGETPSASRVETSQDTAPSAPQSRPENDDAETPPEQTASSPESETSQSSQSAETAQQPKSPADLIALVRPSVVIVTFAGRDGNRAGLGTGFVVGSDGLIATSLHVLGEARPISVELADGRRFDVETIHASEKSVDLALIRIGAKDLPPLELGDSDALQQGAEVIAVGNPHGLKHSVVRGIASGKRKIEGRPMIQLAMPIEPGNSGGPVLDMYGRVQGVLTLKHTTENIGYAMGINALKPLLEKPNPIPISQWLTIGVLDAKQWTTLYGATWRQRAGRILVTGRGSGFGGRSLSLANVSVPEIPFELAVSVKLGEESGAAGLAFHSDGGELHYGFYPSNGGLRLSRFDGPDVFSWNVLREVRSRHYRPGEWNRLKVRIEKDSFVCSVNGEVVIKHRDDRYTAGRVGLVKFRDTEAEFKGFQLAKKIPSEAPSPETVERITKLVADIPVDRPPTDALAESLMSHGSDAPAVLKQQADLFERQAKRLRQLADDVHREQVQAKLVELMAGAQTEGNLLHAALLIASLDNREIDVDAYLQVVDNMAAELKDKTAAAEEAARLEALDKYFFNAQRFHGSRTEYYDRSNSYINEVIDDREGLPITLSVLYIELAKRLGLDVVGIGLPGRFVVRYQPKQGENQLIDVYDAGRRLDREQADAIVRSLASRGLTDNDLSEQSANAIVLRMLRNLMGIARNENDAEGMLRYVDTMVALAPETAHYRWFRAVLRMQTGRIAEARGDTDWLIEKKPGDVNPAELQQLRQLLDRAEQ